MSFISNIIKSVILSRLGGGKGGGQQTYVPTQVPHLNFRKYWTESPNVQSSQVATAIRQPDLQATSRYRRLLEMMMENRRVG
tara:strand:+ start:1093 stop:1338 length:246 start_codon:yes stop_codon:yes gene_type:complete